MSIRLIIFLTTFLAAVRDTNGHAAIVAASGVGGPTGYALGVRADTPRTGTGLFPFQRDTSIIRDIEIRTGISGPCGRTMAGGQNNIQEGVTQMVSELKGLPEVAPGQPLRLTVHQVNIDGAGPYRCDLSQNGAGTDFQPMDIQQNVRGIAGVALGAGATPAPLVLTMPAGMKCAGGPNNNMCIVRCRNAAIAGPFGGCVPVQQGGGGAANAGNAAGDAAGDAVGNGAGDAAGNGAGDAAGDIASDGAVDGVAGTPQTRNPGAGAIQPANNNPAAGAVRTGTGRRPGSFGGLFGAFL